MSRVTATATLEVVSAKMDALTAAIQALVAAQSHAVVTPIAAPVVPANVPTQAPAEVPVAEKYVSSAPAVPVPAAPKHDAKPVIPSVAAWQHDGVLWVAFPPMGNCADEASVLFDALRNESWFVNFDKAGNASAKKSVRVLPYIADKGLAAKYSGHSASIGSFDRAPKLADVAKQVKAIFAARKIVPVEVAKPVKVAPAVQNDAPVFA